MATPKETPIPRFPGWPIISLALPFFGFIAALFIIVTAQSHAGEWFPRETAAGLRLVHVTAVLGFVCSVVAFVRHKHRGLLAPFSLILYFAACLGVLFINLIIALCLIPVWSVQ
jgi:hypothetical protein